MGREEEEEERGGGRGRGEREQAMRLGYIRVYSTVNIHDAPATRARTPRPLLFGDEGARGGRRLHPSCYRRPISITNTGAPRDHSRRDRATR